MAAVRYAVFNGLTRWLGLKADNEIRVLRHFGPIDLAVDVGGNWGQTIVAYQKFCRPSSIVAFEPNPELAGRLRKKHTNVTVHNTALSDAPGTLRLHVPRYRRQTLDGLASMNVSEITDWLSNPAFFAHYDPAHLAITAFDVPAETLDNFNLTPDVVNIDVQGAEPLVLAGGEQTFRAHQPITIVEAPSAAVIARFSELGMEQFATDGRRIWPNTGARPNVMFIAEKWLRRLPKGVRLHRAP